VTPSHLLTPPQSLVKVSTMCIHPFSSSSVFEFGSHELVVRHGLKHADWKAVPVQLNECSLTLELLPMHTLALAESGYVLAFCCCLLDEPSLPGAFNRLLWPNHCSFTINGAAMPVCVRDQSPAGYDPALLIDRRSPVAAVSQLGAAIAAAGASGKPYTFVVQIAGYDKRKFVLVPIIARLSTGSELLNSLEKPLPFKVAVARARSLLTNDGDVEVSSIPVSLICPISLRRIAVPVRFRTGTFSPQIFDFGSSMKTACRTHTWTDPFSGLHGRLCQMEFCLYMAAVLKFLDNAPEVRDIRIRPCGGWQARLSAGWGRLVSPAEMEAGRQHHTLSCTVLVELEPAGAAGAAAASDIIVIDSDGDEPSAKAVKTEA